MKKILIIIPVIILLVGCNKVSEDVSDAAAGINKTTPAVSEEELANANSAAEEIENNNINTAVSAE